MRIDFLRGFHKFPSLEAFPFSADFLERFFYAVVAVRFSYFPLFAGTPLPERLVKFGIRLPRRVLDGFLCSGVVLIYFFFFCRTSVRNFSGNQRIPFPPLREPGSTLTFCFEESESFFGEPKVF